MIEVTRGFRRRFSSLKTTGCVISGPAILLLSTGIVDERWTMHERKDFARRSKSDVGN